ncbi:efflux RND transporter periplasmic adaptor subunit [Lignipirellula cremea]|uniref:Cobalt-zinc-cadmium resistance protein CzcB n=1 Tax=Lignipirellula cremea TaxID=2528010 RepID=A0A518E4L6_9BACT|nr:efflux RND transporter periplasmic adaptor subunit [Lignipirellula cremea]QDU99022.1 Cobalt-zinc-cadmium resistance protein CzcB [Lignipirellula cremea]
MNLTSRRLSLSQLFLRGCVGLAAALLLAGPALAVELEGFVEPYRTISVASDETGVIQEVFVREGQRVEAGQPLARLNSDVHQALLAIAEQSMLAEGRIDAARADVEMRRRRLEKLRSLRLEGHARQEEVDRTAGEVAVGEANLRSALEDQLNKRLEYEKINAQITRRTVKAPIAGAIIRLHKVAGEFVAPNSPDVLTLVQLDMLLANFTLMSPDSAKLQVNQTVPVRFLPGGVEATGVVEFVSPVTDAESGTVLVKIRIDNAQGKFRSGERCSIRIGN